MRQSNGSIWRQPRQTQIPDGKGQSAYVSFAGHMKVTDRPPQANRPIDPAERFPRFSANWPVPILPPVPAKGAEQISLSGTWRFAACETLQSWKTQAVWDEIPVPAEPIALGYPILKNKVYAYQKKVLIPAGWSGQTILLRFSMTMGHVAVYAGETLVQEHLASFTSFDCDLTEAAVPGKETLITVVCMDSNPDDHDSHAPGMIGLIDDVSLIALPKTHIVRLFYTTDFDAAYANAVLRLSVQASGNGMLHIGLADPQEKNISLSETEWTLRHQILQTLEIPVALPQKWDAEHPRLYALSIRLTEESGKQLDYQCRIGFRKVERKGSNLYVNGLKTKLRGAALYGNEPLLGRVFSKKQLEEIVKAAKEANINYLRSSAYPERAALYDLCDQYGIYVEECSPTNFSRGLWDSQRDLKYRPGSDLPSFTEEIMEGWTEMIERDRNHPSIIIWEYANESDWGINFQAELDYAAAHDPVG